MEIDMANNTTPYKSYINYEYQRDNFHGMIDEYIFFQIMIKFECARKKFMLHIAYVLK